MSKKNKAAAKKKRIVTLLVLLAVTGGLSGYAVDRYFKNRPADAEPAAVSQLTLKRKHPQSDEDSAAAADTENTDTAAADNGGEKPADVIELTAPDQSEEKSESTVISDDPQINELMDNMTLHEKVCQMFIVTPESLTGYDLVTESGETTRESLEEYPVGGLIYFAQNLEDVDQTKQMISDTQESNSTVSDIPLFISVDEEGGTVARCADTLGTTEFKPMYDYRKEGTDTAYENAKTIAEDIAELGFACSLKHFPGHGDTEEDSHEGMACSYKTLDELEKEEYLAFESGIEAGADMVMVGHITMVNVDNMPASLSHTIITDELRNKLGYDGLIITDSLAMGALTNYYASDEIAVEVIKAGGDILLMPADMEAAVAGVEEAVSNGDITEDRIDESVIRILELKKEKGMI